MSLADESRVVCCSKSLEQAESGGSELASGICLSQRELQDCLLLSAGVHRIQLPCLIVESSIILTDSARPGSTSKLLLTFLAVKRNARAATAVRRSHLCQLL
jgi:hypothetical protein